MGVFSNKIKEKELKPGDHIYTWRRLKTYAHHGIYVGDGNVINFTRGGGQEIGTAGTVLDHAIFSSVSSNSHGLPCPRCADRVGCEGVISSCLECFLSRGKLYRFEYGVTEKFFLAKVRGGTCTLAQSDPTSDVLHRAKYLLKNGFGPYHLFKNNCEDFALYCRTGLLVLGGSGQASSFLALTNASAASSGMNHGFVGEVVAGVVNYGKSRIAADMGRSDAKKIPVEELNDFFNDQTTKLQSHKPAIHMD